jgi:hypothetical protein
VGSARLSVGSHHTKRFIVAINDAGEETERDLRASDLTWRPLARVQGHTRRGLVEGLGQDWTSPEGGSPLTKQPGEAGAPRSVSLSLLVEQGLFSQPDPDAQFQPHLPAYPVGSLRAPGPSACLVTVSALLRASDAPQEPCPRFTHAVHEGCAFSRAKKPLIQRPLGRLEPTPSLQSRAEEVRRHIPLVST